LRICTASVVPLDDLRAIVLPIARDVEDFAASSADHVVSIPTGVFDVPLRLLLRSIVPQDYFCSIVAGTSDHVQKFVGGVGARDGVANMRVAKHVSSLSHECNFPLRVRASRIVPLVKLGAVVTRAP